ncbi:TRAP transporter substrate-binding protein DctP [Pelagicoccus sp. SDUM812002]|uniref:TRAP transporter substrate-binding protein n=1 Tax=Pelagicoccus sp. SDUM812002 TaxID=3041266 RepID=UPI00280E42B0|nr:TRAP transporter substrate-binding protein DctP [Pelagicoccus sp. SDUM812002]MDQ8184696.1 TRAP transporter substrate-binding protein DctP [Pelagicoccus sp. SDUM812002]
MTVFSKLTRFFAFGALAAATFSLTQDADARRMNIRLSTLAPKDSSFDKSLRKMGQEWKDQTRGQVNLIVFSGGVQGGETAMIDRMRVNQLQAALISGVGLSEIDPGVAGLQQIPMMFHTYEELEYVMEKLGPKLEERIKEKGFIVLSWVDSGWVKIFSKQELATPDDMKKGKLYTWAGDNRQTDLLKNMGFRPVPIDATEVTSSLQTGLVDIVPLPPFFALATQSYRPAPNMLDIRYTPIVGAIVVSEQAWSRISEEDQAVMLESAQRYGREMTLAGREENEEAIKVMKEKWGLKIRDADEAVTESWEKASEQAYSLIRDNTVPADIFDEVVRLLEEYRSQN